MNFPNNANEASLTFTQKAALLVECLPLPFFVLMLVFVAIFLDDITGAPAPIALILFLCFIIFVVGWAALNRVRDLIAGIALVQEDLLHRSWRSRRSAGLARYHGKFEQLGAMRLTSRAWRQSTNGARYRVSYSPASKIVWSLEQLD